MFGIIAFLSCRQMAVSGYLRHAAAVEQILSAAAPSIQCHFLRIIKSSSSRDNYFIARDVDGTQAPGLESSTAPGCSSSSAAAELSHICACSVAVAGLLSISFARESKAVFETIPKAVFKAQPWVQPVAA